MWNMAPVKNEEDEKHENIPKVLCGCVRWITILVSKVIEKKKRNHDSFFRDVKFPLFFKKKSCGVKIKAFSFIFSPCMAFYWSFTLFPQFLSVTSYTPVLYVVLNVTVNSVGSCTGKEEAKEQREKVFFPCQFFQRLQIFIGQPKWKFPLKGAIFNVLLQVLQPWDLPLASCLLSIMVVSYS